MDDARDVFVRRYRDEGWWRPELLTDHVRAWAAKLPYVTAVVDGPLRLTWAQLWDSARRTAAQLARLGVGAGNVVSTQLPNGVEIIVSHLAAELVGAVHNPVALQFRTHELDQIHSLLEPKLMVYPATTQRDDFAAIHAETTPGRNCRVESVGVLFDVDAESEIVGFEQSPMAAHEAAFVLNTSGTVSVKGVTHSHEDALYSTRTVGIDIVRLSPEDTVLCIIPMTWGGGLAWGLRVALHAGATLISVPRWDARAAAEIIDAERCSYVYGPPTVAREPGGAFWRVAATTAADDDLRWGADPAVPLSRREVPVVDATAARLRPDGASAQHAWPGRHRGAVDDHRRSAAARSRAEDRGRSW